MDKMNLFFNVVKASSKYFNIPQHEITGQSRKREIVEARYTAILILCQTGEFTLKMIGLLFGGRDHSTIIYARDESTQRLGLTQYYSFKKGFYFCKSELNLLNHNPNQLKIEF